MIKNLKKMLASYWIAIAAFVLLAFVPFFASGFVLSVGFSLFISIALAQSWNLIAGYTGLVSLGHAAFFGIGAYATGVLMTKLDMGFFLAFVLGAVISTLFAVIVASPMFRFRGFYFTIGTLVLAEALRVWMINWEFTGSAIGIMMPIENWFSESSFYYLALILAVASVLILYIITKSRLGIGLRAIRDNEKSARNSGVNIFRTKLTAFSIASFIAGLAGGVQAEYMGTIEPYSIFSMGWTILVLNIVMIGGIGTIAGPIIGAVLVTILNLLLKGSGAWDMIIMAIILVLVIRFMPTGIWGTIAGKFRKYRSKRAGEVGQ
ncbi:UNVERIFIED_CONTAM: branched-chain amino acid transport system permease protein [Brevibacillus sp. OAP136]